MTSDWRLEYHFRASPLYTLRRFYIFMRRTTPVEPVEPVEPIAPSQRQTFQSVFLFFFLFSQAAW